MTIVMNNGTRRTLNNLETLVMKRHCSVRMIYDIDKHSYIDNGKQKYHPYVKE